MDASKPDPTPPPPPEPGTARRLAQGRFEAAQTLATIGSVGLSFVFAIVIGAWLGWWLDKQTGLSPLFFIVMFLCGLAAGILNVYRAMSRLK